MGARCSKLLLCCCTSNTKSNLNDTSDIENGDLLPAFGEFRLEQLRASTSGFSRGSIVSEHGEKAPNVVYKGRLFQDDDRWIVIKRFNKLSCIGLVKNSRDGESYSANFAFAPPEYFRTGRVIPESVVYSFGTLLLDLLSGKQIPICRFQMWRARNTELEKARRCCISS